MRGKENAVQTPIAFTFRDSGKIFSQLVLGKALIYMQHYVIFLALQSNGLVSLFP